MYNPIFLHTVFVSFVDDQLRVNETFGVVNVCVEIVEGTVDVNSRITLTTTAISATGNEFKIVIYNAEYSAFFLLIIYIIIIMTLCQGGKLHSSYNIIGMNV